MPLLQPAWLMCGGTDIGTRERCSRTTSAQAVFCVPSSKQGGPTNVQGALALEGRVWVPVCKGRKRHTQKVCTRSRTKAAFYQHAAPRNLLQWLKISMLEGHSPRHDCVIICWKIEACKES